MKLRFEICVELIGFYFVFNILYQKVSRETLTRGGSQDDPVQLLRDLQDSVEREADLREQLKFAEEEVMCLSVSDYILCVVPSNIFGGSMHSHCGLIK